jgi:hypothetical protein
LYLLDLHILQTFDIEIFLWFWCQASEIWFFSLSDSNLLPMSQDSCYVSNSITTFPISSLFRGIVDLKSGWGNMFAFTDGTAAWSVQTSPFLERETTLSARGRLRSKASRMYRLCNMLEMIKGFSFFNPEQFRNLSQIKTLSFQGFSNLLPQS